MCDYLIIKSKIRPYLKYYLLTHKEIPKHIVNIIDQTPPITLEDSLELPLENFKIHGKTEQTQLTGKNLFNINSTPVKNSIVVSVSDNTLTQRNTGTYCRSAWKIENLIVGNEYTLSYSFINENGCSIQARIMDSTNSSIIEQSAVTTETSGTSTLTFTATETTHYIRLYSNTLNTSNTDTVVYSNIQFEKGSTSTSYEQYCGGVPSPNPEFPQNIQNVEGNVTIKVANGNDSTAQDYQEQTILINLGDIELCKIGDYEDYFYKENGNWYLHKKIKKSVLDEETYWKYQSINSVGLVNVSTDEIDSNLTSNSFIGMSDLFTAENKSIANATREGFFNSSSSYFYIRIDKDRIGVVEGDTDTQILDKFKNWIANNNITVYSLYNTPLETEITDATLISQLEQLETLTGYNNITIVDVTSSDLTPNISFDYYAKGR